MKMFKQGLMWADAIHSSLIWPLCLGGMERRMTKSGEIHKEFKATILEPSTGEELKKVGGTQLSPGTCTFQQALLGY